jgi:hypothetical protein
MQTGVLESPEVVNHFVAVTKADSTSTTPANEEAKGYFTQAKSNQLNASTENSVSSNCSSTATAISDLGLDKHHNH